MESSWTTNPFARSELSTAGSTLIADPPSRIGGAPRVGKSTGGRPDLFPSDLLSRCSCADSSGCPGSSSCPDSGLAECDGTQDESVGAGLAGWWLAHTLPRQEKAVASALYARDVSYYLPLVTRKSLSRGRTRVAEIALFPGYIFVHGNEEARLNVLKTNRVLMVRPVPDGERLRADLRRFWELICAGAPLLPESRLVTGERVRVKAGPFRDQEGIVIRRNGKTRLMIAIDYLQQGASLEVDDCLLERA